LGRPQLLAGFCVERDGVVVERDKEDLSVVIGEAAGHDIAAGDALSGGDRLGRKLPLQRRAGLGQVQGVDVVRIGGHDIHRVVRHDRGGFLALVDVQ
jgi:hypothetical protein